MIALDSVKLKSLDLIFVGETWANHVNTQEWTQSNVHSGRARDAMAVIGGTQRVTVF